MPIGLLPHSGCSGCSVEVERFKIVEMVLRSLVAHRVLRHRSLRQPRSDSDITITGQIGPGTLIIMICKDSNSSNDPYLYISIKLMLSTAFMNAPFLGLMIST